MKRKGLLATLLLITVGFAAVSTSLFINGSAKINVNSDDFSVYYSDAKVNGTQDLSVIESDISLKFTTTLDTLCQKYVLDYDVTNGSKNYDAALTMNCTGGNEYLTVTNYFDTATNLAALQTRSGKLTLELTKSYTAEDLDVTIACEIKANAVERNSLGEGTAASPVTPNTPLVVYEKGEEVTLAGENFNVIGQTVDTVTLLAKKNLGTNYRQRTTDNSISFSNGIGWEWKTGPTEIDIQSYDGNVKTYVNEYVSYLQMQTGATSISGNIITVAELKTLGCILPEDFDYTNVSGAYMSCEKSEYKEWLVNGQYWWTRSVVTNNAVGIWSVNPYGTLNVYRYDLTNGIRPVITISIVELENYLGNK